MKKAALLLLAIVLLNVSVVYSGDGQSANQSPIIKEGQSEQMGTAIPPSADGTAAAVPYTADVSEWFEDANGDALTYHLTGGPLNGPTLKAGLLTFVPSTSVGNSTFDFCVYAYDGVLKSDKVCVKINVAKMPNDKDAAIKSQRVENVTTVNNKYKNLIVTLNLNGNTLKDIFYNETILQKDRDYIHSKPESITIQNSFLEGLDDGEHILTMVFNGGRDMELEITMPLGPKPIYSVTCTNNIFKFVLEQYQIEHGEMIDLPVLKGNEFFAFDGWWTVVGDGEESVQYTSETPITSNISLRAAWKKLIEVPETDEKNANLKDLSIKLGETELLPSFGASDTYVIRIKKPNLLDVGFERENIFTSVRYAFTTNGEGSFSDGSPFGMSTGFYVLPMFFEEGAKHQIILEVTSQDGSKVKNYTIDINIGEFYSVVYKDGDEEYFKDEVESGEGLVLPATPSKSGHSFMGWFTEENGRGSRVTEDTEIVSDISIYTFWVKNPRKTSGGTPSVLKPVVTHVHLSDTYEPYMRGYPDNTFRPEGIITRAEAAAIFAEVSEDFNENTNYNGKFKDVQFGEWYSNYIAYVDSKTQISHENSDFRPEEPISRLDFCVMLSKVRGILPVDGETVFNDMQDTELEGYVHALYLKDIIKGYTDGSFKPDSTISRAEAAAIVNRALDRKTYTPDAVLPFTDVTEEHWAYAEIVKATTK